MSWSMVLLQAGSSSAPSSSPLGTLYQMVIAGGPLMVPIGLCSVLALGYIVERALALRRRRMHPPDLLPCLLQCVQAGDLATCVERCGDNKSAMAEVLGPGLRKLGAPLLEVEKSVEDAAHRVVARLSGNLRPLQVIAGVAPLLGLLGTVWGMIQAFNVISVERGLGKPELLAGGIAQALITTAAGLAVAIPTHVAYHYFRSRIDRFARDAEEAYVSLVESAARRAQGRAA
ncbi:MAG: MotA/TolQ/ExbB proton channel family protein [Planctomycetota bacterium]